MRRADRRGRFRILQLATYLNERSIIQLENCLRCEKTRVTRKKHSLNEEQQLQDYHCLIHIRISVCCDSSN